MSSENEESVSRISRSDRMRTTNTNSAEEIDNSKSQSQLDSSLRPGAYSKAPGQELQRNGTLEYKAHFRPSHTDSILEGNKEDERDKRKDKKKTATIDAASLHNPDQPLVYEKMTDPENSPQETRLSRGPQELRKATLAATLVPSTYSMSVPSKLLASVKEEEKDSCVMEKATMSDTHNRPNAGGAYAPEERRLSQTSLELRKAALSLTLPSMQSLNASVSSSSKPMTMEDKSTDFVALKKSINAERSTDFVFGNRFACDEENPFVADLDATAELTEHASSSLPLAAEVVKSPQAVEEEIRERVTNELFVSCSLAEAVPTKTNNKRSCWGTAIVVAVVLMILVIVGGVVTGIAIFGTDDPEDEQAENGPVSSFPSDVVITEENENGTSLLMSATAVGDIDDDQESNKDDDDSVLSLLSDNSTIAVIPETICYERAPMMGWSAVCEPQPAGSAVSNLVAASRLWSIPEANISILNAGEVETDMFEGNYTLAMAKTLLPYQSNTLVTIKMDGAYIKIVLERGLQRLLDDVGLFYTVGRSFVGGSYPYASGIRFDVDMTRSFPQRLSNIKVYIGSQPPPQNVEDNDEALWGPIQMQGVMYTVVTNSYLANGGDNYHEFTRQEFYRNETHLNSLEEFVAYCQAHETLLTPPQSHFSTQSYIHDRSIQYCSCATGIYNESMGV
ncbi:5'-nucleotidase [Seminavis robusta]|uniref:5'-nucleotidase n=1 Tax=Seminavis robusta TaxID=568900 RepID=A0A9N8EAN5_9STRA|nr:5'-nucleotidase [Seminavis robusta]|eukprot:Sro811_g205860.1 5'-nucleotidase (678) ;mRNA; r:4389-6422